MRWALYTWAFLIVLMTPLPSHSTNPSAVTVSAFVRMFDNIYSSSTTCQAQSAAANPSLRRLLRRDGLPRFPQNLALLIEDPDVCRASV